MQAYFASTDTTAPSGQRYIVNAETGDIIATVAIDHVERVLTALNGGQS